MLNTKHLAVVRAALRYLNDEFGPEANDSFQHYLDDRDRQSGVVAGDIAETIEVFASVRLATAIVDISDDENLVDPVHQI